METSKETKQITEAFIKVQAALKPIKKNAESVHKAKYANLKAVMDMVLPILEANELAIIQVPNDNGGASLETRLMHSSGEWISGTITVPCAKSNDPQAFGSAMTYGRRYAIMSFLGLVTEDDDAESATVKIEDRVRLT